MTYFSGGELRGRIHPSLQTYVDCFLSSPMPKMYPRGGGPHEQDPILMRDFREIRKIKLQLDEQQEQVRRQQQEASGGGGGGMGLEGMLDRALEEYDY